MNLLGDDSLKTTGYILTLAVIIRFTWLNHVTDLHHNAFATTESSNKLHGGFIYLILCTSKNLLMMHDKEKP